MRWSAGQTFILATFTFSHSAHEFLNSAHDVFITGEYGLFLFDDLWGIDIIFLLFDYSTDGCPFYRFSALRSCKWYDQ